MKVSTWIGGDETINELDLIISGGGHTFNKTMKKDFSWNDLTTI